VCDYVGRCDSPAVTEKEATLHVYIQTRADWVIAQINLFPPLGAPYYEVVVGRPFCSRAFVMAGLEPYRYD
jgi:hypothetical protein